MSTRTMVFAVVLWWALFTIYMMIGPPGIVEMALFVLGIVVIIGIWALRRPKAKQHQETL